MRATFLVPIDGSPFSERALPAALAIAGRTGARVDLVRVHEAPPVVPPPGGVPVYDAAWDHAIREQEESHLRALAARAGERGGVDVRAEVIDGPVVDALAEYAAAVDAALIVMTTHGRGGFSRLWLGSIADGLVRRATRPVLLLRPAGEGEGEGAGAAGARRHSAPSFQHILIPTDGSEFSERAIRQAVALGEPFGARYTLLRVVAPAFTPGGPYLAPVPVAPDLDREHAHAAEALEALAEELRARSLRVKTAVVVDNWPAVAIIDYAERNGVDLIAMTTHARAGWSRIALGSVSDKVLRGTRTPLLLYRPAEGARPPADAGEAFEERRPDGTAATAASRGVAPAKPERAPARDASARRPHRRPAG